MNGLFNSLAVIVGILAVIQLLVGLFPLGDFMVGASRLIGLLHAYGWSVVGDISEDGECLRKKVGDI
jgi:hypothetical protein